MSPRVFAVALLAFVLAAGAAACGGDSTATETTATVTTPTEPTPTETTATETTPLPSKPTVVRIVVEGGVPKGGIVRSSVKKGDHVVIVVESDVADEVHLHGYDLTEDVAAGRIVRIPFTATIPGRFEVELEERGRQIAELTVQP